MGDTSIPTAAWLRLTRMAALTRTALLLLSNERLAGSHADIALAMESTQARFTGTPALLEELETRAVLVRHRTAPVNQSVDCRPDSRELDSSKPSTELEVTPHESAA